MELSLFHFLVLNSLYRFGFLSVFHFTYLFHGKSNRLCLKKFCLSIIQLHYHMSIAKTLVLLCCPLWISLPVFLYYTFFPMWYKILLKHKSFILFLLQLFNSVHFIHSKSPCSDLQSSGKACYMTLGTLLCYYFCYIYSAKLSKWHKLDSK